MKISQNKSARTSRDFSELSRSSITSSAARAPLAAQLAADLNTQVLLLEAGRRLDNREP